MSKPLTTIKNVTLLLITTSLTLILAACGGSGSDSVTPPDNVQTPVEFDYQTLMDDTHFIQYFLFCYTSGVNGD